MCNEILIKRQKYPVLVAIKNSNLIKELYYYTTLLNQDVLIQESLLVKYGNPKKLIICRYDNCNIILYYIPQMNILNTIICAINSNTHIKKIY